MWIKFPLGTELNMTKIGWTEHYNFPRAIGAIDCTQIRMMKSSEHGDEYVNRQGEISINVQLVKNIGAALFYKYYFERTAHDQ